MIGLAIKCTRAAIVSWVGNDTMHCSVSTDGGLRSLFMASSHRPVRYHLIHAAFLKLGRNKGLKKHTRVVVRLRDDNVTTTRRKKKPPFKYLNAVVVKEPNNNERGSIVTVRYDCNKLVEAVSTNHVCKSAWIKNIPSWRNRRQTNRTLTMID